MLLRSNEEPDARYIFNSNKAAFSRQYVERKNARWNNMRIDIYSIYFKSRMIKKEYIIFISFF